MGKHRSKLQVIADILLVVRNGATKTRIMRKANLSYKHLSRYLPTVIDADLVKIGNANCYTLTRRGQEFLNKYEEYSKRYKKFEELFNNLINERSALENICFDMNMVDTNLKNMRNLKRDNLNTTFALKLFCKRNPSSPPT